MEGSLLREGRDSRPIQGFLEFVIYWVGVYGIEIRMIVYFEQLISPRSFLRI